MSKKLVAYCGLYCPKCYRMKVSAAAELLKKELESAGEKGAPYLSDCGTSFPKSLDELIILRCNKFCRERKELTCKIKVCCINKKLTGCWECNDFTACNKLKKQFIENCKKIKATGIKNFIQQYD